MDVAEIQEDVTDELKKVEKEEFSAAFQKLYDHTEAFIYVIGAHFELKKKVCVLLMCLQFLKKISPKTFGPHCVCNHLCMTFELIDFMNLFHHML